MTEIYLHIVARMADYMATHPYGGAGGITSVFQHRESSAVLAAKANHMHTTPGFRALAVAVAVAVRVRVHLIGHARNNM